ncbi:MAG: aminoacyl-tRNA hydrolase [Corynebacterium sp.]|nr:aminoacyl-tRNA hydrolase [Corynebacterium sp.]
MKASTVLVVGLGNPGPQYELTRHNIGFMVADELAMHNHARFSAHRKTNSEIAEIRRVGSDRRMVIAKPRTFMNNSGGAIKGLAQYFSVTAENVIVVCDEMDINFGSFALKLGGGDHGHNGLRSTTKALGTAEYNRLFMGIGRPPGRMAPKDYVLKPFGKTEQQELPILCADAVDAIEAALKL